MSEEQLRIIQEPPVYIGPKTCEHCRLWIRRSPDTGNCVSKTPPWPYTEPKDFCGEFTPRIPPPSPITEPAANDPGAPESAVKGESSEENEKNEIWDRFSAALRRAHIYRVYPDFEERCIVIDLDDQTRMKIYPDHWHA